MPHSLAPLAKQVVDHDRLVRAMERADAEVNDARRDRARS